MLKLKEYNPPKALDKPQWVPSYKRFVNCDKGVAWYTAINFS